MDEMTLPSSRRWRHAWAWPVVLAVGIFLASSRSQIAEPDINHIDKVAHFAVYGLLATLLCRLGRRGWRTAGWALLAASLYGITDEWHQSFTPGRSVEVADWLADTTGAALAVTLYTAWPCYRRWLEMRLGRKRRIEKRAEVTPSSEP
jgi:VanZ family protein